MLERESLNIIQAVLRELDIDQRIQVLSDLLSESLQDINKDELALFIDNEIKQVI